MLTVMDLCARHGIDLKRKSVVAGKGMELAGPCPGCGGTDRFSVWCDLDDGRGRYYCRGCRCHGDAIQFLQDFEGMTWKEAAQAAGRDPASLQRRASSSWEPEREAPQRIAPSRARPMDRDADKWLAEAEHFTATRHAAILQNPPALEYLAGRGLDMEAVRRFRLGWQAGENGKSGVWRRRSVWGLPVVRAMHDGEKDLSAFFIPRGWVIPSVIGGRVRRLRIRRPDQDREAYNPSQKYKVIPGSERDPLFIPDTGAVFREPVCCIVVEAELDAMLLARAAGDFCCVLGLGTAKVAELPQNLMDTIASLPVLLIATDVGDASRAGEKGWELWKATFRSARRWPCVGGKDPGEMYQAAAKRGEDGHAAVRAWALAGLPAAFASRVEQAEARKITPPDAAGQTFPGGQGSPGRTPHGQAGCGGTVPPAAIAEADQDAEGADIPVEIAEARPFDLYTLRRHVFTPEAALTVLEGNGVRVLPTPDGDIVLDWRRMASEKLPALLHFIWCHRGELDRLAAQLAAKETAA